MDVDGEQVGVLVLVAIHQEQQALAVAAPPEGFDAGPRRAQFARRVDDARGRLLQTAELQFRQAVAHADPGEPGAVRRYPVVPVR